MPDFSKAREGDRVFSILSGWGEIADTKGTVYPLLVKFEVGSSNCYIMDGRLDRDDIRADLYWDEVTLNIPKSALTLPKRKVKKYILYDKFRDSGSVAQFRIFGDQQLADVCRESWSDRYDGPFEIEIEE